MAEENSTGAAPPQPGSETAQTGQGREDSNPPEPERRRPGKWPLFILAVVVAAAVIAAVWYYLDTRNIQSTDDAYIGGRAIAIASKVSGYVVELRVNDNTRVHAGDVLLRIDPRDYAASRDQAAAALALAHAQLDNAKVNLEMARVTFPARLAEAEAQRDAAAASLALAQTDARRQRTVDARATTQEAVDTAAAQVKTATAALAQNQAQLDVATLVPQNIAQAGFQVRQLEAQAAQAQAQLDAARLNLSYAEIRAPQDGWITKRNVELGTYLQTGQSVFSIVTPEVWVIANFKETQLTRMRPGQKAQITVDGYPQLRLTGHVDSIQMGTGSLFTAFPPENATGNWVKIVQRVPVKIVIDSGLDPDLPLPLGISVEPAVTVK
jgi:membrane fusion protein (multidrug efflux system)